MYCGHAPNVTTSHARDHCNSNNLARDRSAVRLAVCTGNLSHWNPTLPFELAIHTGQRDAPRATRSNPLQEGGATLHAARRQPARSALPCACHPCARFFGAVPFFIGHAVTSLRVAASRLGHNFLATR